MVDNYTSALQFQQKYNRGSTMRFSNNDMFMLAFLCTKPTYAVMRLKAARYPGAVSNVIEHIDNLHCEWIGILKVIEPVISDYQPPPVVGTR